LEEEMQQFVQVSVVDTGVGIAENDQDKLFKLFGFV
jgi:signal transduction histidine kinase